MMTQEQREKIKFWFETFHPSYPSDYKKEKEEAESYTIKIVLTILAGLILIVFAISQHAQSELPGTLAVATIIFLIYFIARKSSHSSLVEKYESDYNRDLDAFNSRISVSEFDELINIDKDWLEKRALEDLSLEESNLIADTKLIKSIPNLKIGWGTPQKLRFKGIEEMRFNIMQYNFFIFTEKKLCLYSATFDHLLGKIREEECKELYYRDIESVSTITVTQDYMGQECQQRAMRLNTSGGDRSVIVLHSNDLFQKLRATLISEYRSNGAYEEADALERMSENVNLEGSQNAENTVKTIRRQVDERKE